MDSVFYIDILIYTIELLLKLINIHFRITVQKSCILLFYSTWSAMSIIIVCLLPTYFCLLISACIFVVLVIPYINCTMKLFWNKFKCHMKIYSSQCMHGNTYYDSLQWTVHKKHSNFTYTICTNIWPMNFRMGDFLIYSTFS